MLIASALTLAILLAQQPPPADSSRPEVTLLKADIGTCSADFTVKDTDGKPVYGAKITVNIRYGFGGLRRADLEIGTNPDGRARVEGLPEKTRKPLAWEIRKNDRKATVEQKVADTCAGTYVVTLK